MISPHAVVLDSFKFINKLLGAFLPKQGSSSPNNNIVAKANSQSIGHKKWPIDRPIKFTLYL